MLPDGEQTAVATRPFMNGLSGQQFDHDLTLATQARNQRRQRIVVAGIGRQNGARRILTANDLRDHPQIERKPGRRPRTAEGLAGPIVATAKTAIFIAWIWMLVKVSQSQSFKLPLIGELAERSVAEQR